MIDQQVLLNSLNPQKRTLYRRQWLDLGLRWMRACAVCGSFGLAPIDLLCESCLERLFGFKNHDSKLNQAGYPFKVHSLYTWTKENEDLIRPFIMGLKGGLNYFSLKDFAESLAHSLNVDRRERIILHPPSSSGRPDHAYVLANLMGEILNSPVIGLAETEDRATLGKQKQKSARERYERRLQYLGDRALFSKPCLAAVFVDDVITSGATAMAAYMALEAAVDHTECGFLKNASDFVVCTIVNRPKLAGFSGV